VLDFEGRPVISNLDDQVLQGAVSWIWSDEQIKYLDWIKVGKTPFLMTGNPGSGKSTVMKYLSQNRSVIADTLNQHWHQSPIFATYCFNYHGNSVQRSIEGLLRSIIYEILKQQSSLFLSAFPRLQSIDEFRRTFLPWTQSQLEQVIEKALSICYSTPFVFLVDGLDEYDGDRTKIAKFVYSFTTRAPKNLRFCVSSRPDTDFEFEFKHCPTFRVEKYTTADIWSYVHERLGEAQQLLGDNALHLAQKVTEKAQGVFLWVRLVLDSLQRGWRKYENLQDLQKRLYEMPRDLVDLYQRIFDEMDPEDKYEAYQLLIIVMCARRPLSSRELYFASKYSSRCFVHTGQIRCNPPTSQIHDSEDYQQTLQLFEGRVHAICRSLLQTYATGANEGRFHLLHETVHSFMQKRIIGQTHLPDRMLGYHGNFMLLHACIHYLTELFGSSGEFRWTLVPRHAKQWSETETDFFALGAVHLNYIDYIVQIQEKEWNTQNLYPFPMGFFHYAVEYWLDHAIEAEVERKSGNNAIINDLYGSSFDLWRRLFQIHNRTRGRKLPVNKLALAIEAGLEMYVAEEIKSPESSLMAQGNSTFHKFKNLLLFSVAKTGNTRIAELLLQSGAIPYLNESYASELRAQLQGPKVKLGYLRHWGQAALPRAIHFDQTELAMLLVRYGALLVMSTTVPLTSMWLETGGIAQMQVFSQGLGVPQTFTSGRSMTVGRSGRRFVGGEVSDLPWATRNSSWIENILLIFAKNDSARNEDICTSEYHALAHAVRRGSYRTLSQLLTIARSQGLSEEINSTLIIAVERGREEYVTLLLENGANPAWSRPGKDCLKSEESCCALLLAANKAEPAMVTALMEAGADPNFQSHWESCRTPRGHPHVRPIDIAVEKLVTFPQHPNHRFIISQMIQYGGNIPQQHLNKVEDLLGLSDLTTLETPEVAYPYEETTDWKSERYSKRAFSFELDKDGMNK
jgi:hypothetical protein